MGLILDTSILVAAERKRFDFKSFILAEAPSENYYISIITVSELLHGVYRASGKRRVRRNAFVEAIIQKTPILQFDLSIARFHAELSANLETSGFRIGAHDLIIAATCLRFNYKIATLNEKEFERVDGLVLMKSRPYLLNCQ